MLRLGATVIQMKFVVITDLLKRRKLNRLTPVDLNFTMKMWNTKVSF